MKKILSTSLFAILLSLNAQAAYAPIALNQLQAYKNAAEIAIRNKYLNSHCSSPSAFTNMISYLRESTSSRLEAGGKQPLLIFEKITSTSKSVLTIVTSEDFQSAVSMKVEYYQVGLINVGNLKQPDIQDAYLLQSSQECH